MIIKICVGSSCHLKGSERLVELFQSKISELSLSDEVTLAGSFCTGRCNREGVTVIIDDEVFTGLTPEKFDGFFDDNVLKKLSGE